MAGISALALAAAGVLTTSSSSDAQTQWNGNTSSDWFDANNWSNGVPGPYNAFNAPRYDATIDNGAAKPAKVGSPGAQTGTLIVGNAATGRLDITAGGGLTVLGVPGLGVFPLSIGDLATGNGVVTVSGAGASLTSSSGIAVGRAGAGRLDVSNGASVTSSLGYVGADAGGQGTVVVDAASWAMGRLFVGNYGTGQFTLQNGGTATVTDNLGATAGNYANSTGTITVTGAGSSLDDQGFLASMTLGYNGTGHLIVSNQGTVTSMGTCMGCGTGGVGTALVTGAGSKWQFTDTNYEYVIGGSGTGTLTVSDNGLVQADGNGLIITVGSVATGRGTVHLTTGGKAQFDTLNLGGWTAGSAGSIGEAIVESGGRLSSKGGNVGGFAGALGKVTVTGAGSRWDHTSQLTLGYEGRGEMTVSAGGEVASQSAIIASNPGSAGTATVTGANSKWTNTQHLFVGNRGVGSLFVQNGGEVGTGSLSVGPGGQGTLEISGGSKLTTNTAMIGTNGTGGNAMSPTTGDVLVTGAGSSLIASTWIWAGNQKAQGSLTIADGATVSINNGVYDAATFAGILYLGDDSATGSAGTLNIGGKTAAAAPGTLTAAGVAFNTPSDTLNFNHTSANYNFAASLAGNGVVNVRAGTTHLTGDSSTLFDGFVGQVNVLGGKLYVDNKLGGGAGGAGPVAVSSGGLLGGTGTIAGAVTVADGGILEGPSGQVLTMGSLVLNPNSNVNVALGAPSATALFSVAGAFTLDGRLNVSNAGGFANGNYRLFDYGGTLANNGLVIQSLPSGFNPGDWSIDTGTGGQVSLVVAAGPGEQYWDSTNTTPGNVANGRGGPGTWNTTSTNWTNQAGTINAPWASGVAVFGNAAIFVPGNTYDVTVDAGGVTAAGLKAINTDPYTYVFSGGPITLKPGATITTGSSRFDFRSQLDTLGSLFITGGVRIIDGDSTMAGPLTVDAGGFVRIEATSAGPGVFTHPAVRLLGDAVTIGAAGIGKLFVNQGSSLFSQGGVLGAQVGSNGAVDVSNRSIWDAGAGDIVIGDAGTGALRVLGLGGTPSELKAANIVLGRAATGYGTLTLMDAPTAVTATRVSGGLGGGEVIFDGGPSQGLFAPVLGGNLSVSIKSSEVHLADVHDYVGPSTISGGALILDGAHLTASNVTVTSGTLGGYGAIDGAVSIASGGHLKGESGRTLTMASLALSNLTAVDVTLGAPASQSLFNVTGNLTLDGQLRVTAAPGYGDGVYRLFDYAGALTDNGLDIASLPPSTSSATVQTAITHQVNLVVGTGPGPVPMTQFWKGTTTVADGTIHGGSGTWIAGPTNWTDANGSAAGAWGGRFAVFQNNPGAVTVDNSAGAISTTGMQFIGAGWTAGGDPITLNGAGGSTTIRVGDGTAAGASHFATIASELTGNSQLVKNDLGTLTLTGANSYTGGTTIANGILQIGNGGTAGSITGDVWNNGSLVFNRSDATVFGGTVTGSGGVQLVSGDLTFTANNSYAFGTDIAVGSTLRLGNGGTSGSIAGRVANAGTLAFNRSDYFSFAGFFIGNGAIRQIGAGTTELTGDSSGFAGATAVESGTLAVNGKLGGALDVWAGARLQGVGTVGDARVSGTIAPGNSIGTLNVAGNITFNAGSVYEVEVNAAGQSDRIVATGAAILNGGSVKVLAGMGNYAPATTYTILSANGGRTGTFTGGVTSNLAFLDPALSYDANNVYLTMIRNGVTFNNMGITPNQIATGGGVESLGLSNVVYGAVLNLSAPQAQYAFDQLSGEIHASAKTALIEDSRFIRNAVNDRIRAAFDGVGASKGDVVTYVDGKPVPVAATTDRLAVWGQGFGSWSHTDSDGNAAKLNRKTGGFFIGADAPVFDTWRFGSVAGYSRTDFDVKDRRSTGTSDNYHLGLYGGTQWGDLAFRSGAAYTWHDISISRNVTFPGFGDRLKGDYNAATAQVFSEFAYGFNAGGVRFEPFANLAYVNLHTDSFRENGGAAALTNPSSNSNATFTTLGLRASTTFDMGGATLTAKGMLGWRHAFGDVTPLSTMRFAGGGDIFSIGGVPIARNAAVIEAGLDYAISPNATLSVTYGGQFGSGLSDHSAKANFNVQF